MIQNYPFFPVINRRKFIDDNLKMILTFWITSEMIYLVMRDPQVINDIESGSEIARFNEMMSLTPEGF